MDGQKYIGYVSLSHGGTFRPSPDQNWMNIDGVEYFTIENPGFFWFASIKPVPVLSITARDMYYNGKGNMLIKAASLYTISDARGDEMDEGALMRWLAEAIWYPTAFLPSEMLQWTAINESSAKVTFQNSGMSVSLVFYFNDIGQVTEIRGDRYRSVGDSFSRDEWVGYCSDYRQVDGMMIPHYVDITWNLAAGEYSYARFTITEIEFDNATRYR
jgi:hypothetical protein